MSFDDSQATLAELIRAPFSALSDDEAIERVGHLIDLATEKQSDTGIKRAFGMLKEIGRRPLLSSQEALLLYFRANAHMGERIISGEKNSGTWDQPARQEHQHDARRRKQARHHNRDARCRRGKQRRLGCIAQEMMFPLSSAYHSSAGKGSVAKCGKAACRTCPPGLAPLDPTF